MKIKVEDASASQLANFARVNFGIEVDHRKGRDNILSLLASTGWSEAEIEVEDGSETRAQEKMPAAPAQSRGKVRIMIPTDKGPGGQNDVVGGVNFRSFQIKRGVPVEVSREIYNALMDARVTMYSRDENGAPVNPVEVMSYTVNLVADPA